MHATFLNVTPYHVGRASSDMRIPASVAVQEIKDMEMQVKRRKLRSGLQSKGKTLVRAGQSLLHSLFDKPPFASTVIFASWLGPPLLSLGHFSPSLLLRIAF